jgi:hypothetical protein
MGNIKAAALGLFLCGLLVPLGARGTAEESPVLNTEYVLCVTVIDVSELPPSQQIQGLIFQRELVNRLSRIGLRKRSGEELNRYVELAWNAARREAAGKLAEKRLERDNLLFQGLPRWKYKRECKRIDEEIAELEKGYREADTEVPVIAEAPVLVLKNIPENQEQDQEFPPPPLPGGEEAFLAEHSVDAFISGKMQYLYGRIYLELFLYTRGSAYSFEQTLIYSPEDMIAATGELKEAFASAVSGSVQALLRVHAEPEEAQVVVNGKLVRSGEELRVDPGELIITASARGWKNLELKTELEGGEETSLDISLDPLNMEKLGIAIPGIEDATVYLGALYVGKLSGIFEMEVPEGLYSYISTETEDGRNAQAIVLGEAKDEQRIISFDPKAPPEDPQKKSVETLRKKFYGAYGRFWIALPLAFLANGLYNTNALAYNASTGSEALYDSAKNSYYLTVGLFIGAGLFLAESLIRLVVYVRAADKEAVPFYE